MRRAPIIRVRPKTATSRIHSGQPSRPISSDDGGATLATTSARMSSGVRPATVALGVAAFTRVPGWLNVVLVVLDVALFAFLFKVLRARYLDARRERTFARRR